MFDCDAPSHAEFSNSFACKKKYKKRIIFQIDLKVNEIYFLRY